MPSTPKSPLDKVGGMTWFPRMLDKIRLHDSGELHPDFQHNLGTTQSIDGFCCRYLRTDYTNLKARVAEGGADEEILEWCFEKGRRLDEIDIWVWNEFIRKFGWNDIAARLLKKLKAKDGFSERDDIQTMVEYMEVDEGRNL